MAGAADSFGEAASEVGVHVMDCTRTGAPPPTATEPMWICRALDTTAGARVEKSYGWIDRAGYPA